MWHIPNPTQIEDVVPQRSATDRWVSRIYHMLTQKNNKVLRNHAQSMERNVPSLDQRNHRRSEKCHETKIKTTTKN
ncbi:hypothetical protein APICC_01947 [Apis cerana cerana]|uniref:Uncharacterized protein n=1 Tax=Apis cerana cerana TaxID=94128 RepID=A0A2A3E0E0_APICC|nr:hypothetical protein APICC_01947 [Apis cerana cerana]